MPPESVASIFLPKLNILADGPGEVGAPLRFRHKNAQPVMDVVDVRAVYGFIIDFFSICAGACWRIADTRAKRLEKIIQARKEMPKKSCTVRHLLLRKSYPPNMLLPRRDVDAIGGRSCGGGDNGGCGPPLLRASPLC